MWGKAVWRKRFENHSCKGLSPSQLRAELCTHRSGPNNCRLEVKKRTSEQILSDKLFIEFYVTMGGLSLYPRTPGIRGVVKWQW